MEHSNEFLSYGKACEDLQNLIEYDSPGRGPLFGDFWFGSEESMLSFVSCLAKRWGIPKDMLKPDFRNEAFVGHGILGDRINFCRSLEGCRKFIRITAHHKDKSCRLDIGCHAHPVDTGMLVKIMDSRTEADSAAK